MVANLQLTNFALLRAGWLLAAIGVCLLGGCYDGEQLLLEARSTALNSRLAEVDLGRFVTTLPRDLKSGSFTEINMRIFVAVPRSLVSTVTQELKAEEYRVRHDTLAAVRGASADELAEPNLALLRKRIAAVVNAILTDHPVRSIGFYDVALRRR
jgi:hypothetical protein